MNKILLLLALAGIIGCSPKIYQTSSSENADSLVVTEKIVTELDTVYVTLPAQSSSVVAKDTTSHLETDYAVSEAEWSNGMLTHTLSNKQELLPVVVPVTTHAKETEYLTRTIFKESAPVYIERELTKWQKLQMRGFWVLLLVVAVFLYLKYGSGIVAFVRKFLPLQRR